MTEPDESRPGGMATPPPADPAPPATDTDTGTGAPDGGAGAPHGTASPPPAATHDTPPATFEPVGQSTPAAPSTPSGPAAQSAPAAGTTPAPQPTPTPTAVAPAPAPAPAPVATAGPTSAGDEFDDGFDEDPLGGYPGPRWIGLTTILGAGMVGVVTLQVLMALVEAFSLKADQRFGVPDDLLHRIGYPFGSLGSTAMFFLVLAAVLLALPAIVGEEVSDRQYAIAGAALRTALVLGVIVALGSILAVRGSLHEYSAKNVAVPGFVRVQFTSFLLATLGSAALAIVGALVALRVRDDT